MLIRNQDKTCLINIAQVTNIFYNKGGDKESYRITAVLSSDERIHLGKYSLEEKTIKILDMIERAYCKSFEEKKQNYTGHRYDLIFQMPKDEEVEE